MPFPRNQVIMNKDKKISYATEQDEERHSWMRVVSGSGPRPSGDLTDPAWFVLGWR